MIICRCEDVHLIEVENAISDGAKTVPGIKLRTRSCMGPCQGRMCQSMIERVLISKDIQPINDFPIRQRVQNPVRPVKLESLIKNWGNDKE